MKKIFFLAFILLSSHTVLAQDVEAFDFSKEWLSKTKKLIPTNTHNTSSKKNILIFSLHTGYDHWTIPHTEAVILN